MIGSPIPCGIVVAKRQNVERISVDVDYISTRDQTISGSRNGHTVLLMWAAIRSQTNLQRRQRIQHCLKMAQYAVDRFQAVGIPAWRNRIQSLWYFRVLLSTSGKALSGNFRKYGSFNYYGTSPRYTSD